MDLAKIKDQPREQIKAVFQELYLKTARPEHPKASDWELLELPITAKGLIESLVDISILISKQQSEINELRNEITRIKIAI